MKRFVFSVLLLAVAVQSRMIQAQNIQINRDNRTIAVTATDEAEMVADLPTVSVGFEVYAADQTRHRRQGQPEGARALAGEAPPL